MAQTMTHLLIIDLKNLPATGQSYFFDHNDREMKNAIKDLVGENFFKIQLHIEPTDAGLFIVSGHIETQMNLQCYRCGIDFHHPIKEKVNEILMIESERPRASHSTKVNHSSELEANVASVSTISHSLFHLGDFVHELIAIAEPLQPKAKENCDDQCENLQEAFRQGWLTKSGEPAKNLSSVTQPFAILKNFKLNR